METLLTIHTRMALTRKAIDLTKPYAQIIKASHSDAFRAAILENLERLYNPYWGTQETGATRIEQLMESPL